MLVLHQVAVLVGSALDTLAREQDAVLHGLMQSLALAQCPRIGGRAAGMLNALSRKPLGKLIGEKARSIVRQQSRLLSLPQRDIPVA